MTRPIILIDDEKTMLRSLEQWLSLSDFSVTAFSNALDALAGLNSDFAGVIVSDIKMPEMDGLALLSAVKELDADIPVILMTGHGDVPITVDAMKRGAYDFLEKPFSPERLADIATRAFEQRTLLLENRRLKRRLAESSGLSRYLIGESSVMRDLRAELVHLAATDVSVLLQGETGTGKELAARALHDFSHRANCAFQAINCGAIPDELFESEFFGHKAGAFTGADNARTGTFEFAKGGTVFLDEVTSLPLSMQVKLLRVLQERTVQRVGSNELLEINVRVVAAGNEDVSEAVKSGRFRDDLYYRLNTIELHMPPLRVRGEDILLLFKYFITLAEKQFERSAGDLTSGDIVALRTHPWPGNVRELKNIAERFVLLRNHGTNDIERLINTKTHEKDSAHSKQSLAGQMAYFEKSLIEQSLKRHEGNISAVMDELSVPRRTLNDKMSRYNLTRETLHNRREIADV